MKHLLLASSLLPLSLLAACGDGDAPAYDASFSAADEATRMRAVSAAAGFDYGIAYFMGSIFAGYEDLSGCPSVDVEGHSDGTTTTTVTGGCTTDDGTRFEGRLVMQNVSGFLTEEPPASLVAQSLSFEDFAITDADGTWLIDGTIDIAAGERPRVTTDLYVAMDGDGARSHLDLSADEQGVTTLAAGSWIDVDGLGGAGVSGTFSMSTDAPSGALTLTGADTLVLDFDRMVDGCVPITIDGEAAGELCEGAE